MAVWGLLDCRIKPWVEFLAYPSHAKGNKILIICYDWQADLAKELFKEISDRKEIRLQVVG
jgi:hypothetical protein